MTPQQVSDTINKLKPDFKQFWADVNHFKYNSAFTPHSNPAITLFQIELLQVYYALHNQRYMRNAFKDSITTVLNQIQYTGLTNFGRRINHDIANKSGAYPHLILAYVTDVKQYLNPYLRKRLEFTTTKGKDIKQLQDNEFSVELFKSSLGKRKLPSTEVSMYFKQFKDFSQPIRDKFMNIVFEHCKEPSKKLQVELQDSRVFNVRTTSGSKYISVSRRTARQNLNTNSLPIPEDLHNERDSDYTPFICGVPRKPTPTKHEVSALIGVMLVVKCSDLAEKGYIVSCIKEHLSHPGYGTLCTDQLKALRNYTATITELTKDI